MTHPLTSYMHVPLLVISREAAFTSRLETFIKPHATPGTNDTTAIDERIMKTSSFAISNLLGGATVFRGSTLVKGGPGMSIISTPHGELYTSVPSRSFFPRGFFWDEGFHQLITVRWNHTITMEVISSWLSRMNEDVRREQNLYHPHDVHDVSSSSYFAC